MNVRSSQVVYRVPYVYVVASNIKQPLLRIGHTLRPAYEIQRMQARYAEASWLCGVRAYAVLASILWRRFEYCLARGQWFYPDRRLSRLVEQFAARDAEKLLTVDQLREVFAYVFPESPYVGVADYMRSQTYLEQSRYLYVRDGKNLGK